MIQLDGAAGEGGGQILRSALTLSLLTGRAFRLTRIRAGRKKPGLAAQHLACVKAAAEVGRATLTGAALASTELTFRPHAVRPGEFEFPIGTAGATALVVQTVALPLILRGTASSHVVVTGGTHAAHAPTFDYLAQTWGGYLNLMGLGAAFAMEKSGFYPRGGGRITARFAPASTVHRVTLTARPELSASGVSFAAGLPETIAERQATRLRESFAGVGVECLVGCERWSGGPGSVVSVRLDGGPVPTTVTALGERGKRAEAVADEAFDAAWAFMQSGAAVDPHAADQIVLPLAFADAESLFTVSEVTEHLLTNVEVIRSFTDARFEIDGVKGTPGTVQVRPAAV